VAGWKSGVVVVGFRVRVSVFGFLAFWLSGFLDWLLLVSLVGWFDFWSFGNWDRGFGIDVLAFLSFFLFDYSCS